MKKRECVAALSLSLWLIFSLLVGNIWNLVKSQNLEIYPILYYTISVKKIQEKFSKER